MRYKGFDNRYPKAFRLIIDNEKLRKSRVEFGNTWTTNELNLAGKQKISEVKLIGWY
jgi:hypothetical protein